MVFVYLPPEDVKLCFPEQSYLVFQLVLVLLIILLVCANYALKSGLVLILRHQVEVLADVPMEISQTPLALHAGSRGQAAVASELLL